jgi:hypothetical protein
MPAAQTDRAAENAIARECLDKLIALAAQCPGIGIHLYVSKQIVVTAFDSWKSRRYVGETMAEVVRQFPGIETRKE